MTHFLVAKGFVGLYSIRRCGRLMIKGPLPTKTGRSPATTALKRYERMGDMEKDGTVYSELEALRLKLNRLEARLDDGKTREDHPDPPASSSTKCDISAFSRMSSDDQLEIYRIFIDSLPLGFVLADGKGRVITENKAAREILDRSSAASAGCLFEGMDRPSIRPDGSPLPLEEYAGVRALRDGVIIESQEMGIVRGEDDVFWLNLHAVPIGTKFGGVAVIFFDDTESMRAQAQLKHTQDYARNIIDSTLGMIVATNRNRRIVEFNKAAQETFGYTEEEIIGQHINVLYADENEGEAIAEEQARNGFFYGEITNICKDGRTFPSLLSASAMRGPGGEVIGAVGNSQDITERKAAEEALAEKERALRVQARHLEEANTALGVLLDRRDEEKKSQEADMLATMEKLVVPYLDKLANTSLSREQRVFLTIAVSNLTNLTSPLARKLTTLESKLTPTELEVADLLRHGKTTKDIADLLNISTTTISFHRRNIRQKLGLVNEKTNLKTYLRTHS